MSSSLKQQVERVKSELERRFSITLSSNSSSVNCYPDLFELWTLFNVIKAVANDHAGELYSVNSYMKRGVASLIVGDVHPSGRVQGATVERVGLGLAPTLTVSSQSGGTSIWYDKYVGVSLDGNYWPRPDIVMRSGTYDVLKSVRFETQAQGNNYSGGYDIRRGRVDSETVKGWRSLSELVTSDPQLRGASSELVSNFKVTKELFSLISNENEQVQAFAGQPVEALPFDDGNFAYGQVQSDLGAIHWARRKSFTQPDFVIECKSGLMTPHAVEQLATYRECLPSTPLIAVTTKMPDRDTLRRFCELRIQFIAPPETLAEGYAETLRRTLAEANEDK